MDSPAVIYALRWLIKDTFLQALTSRVFWILLGLSVLCIVFCLGVSIEGGAVREGKELFTSDGQPFTGGKATGRMSLLFGVFAFDFVREAQGQVHFLQGILASWIGGLVGILLALIWTAGFVPDSLQPSAASVLLAKPAPRWLILTGKYLGVVLFVGLHATIFFAGTWLALGVRTGCWNIQYLLGIPLLTLHFAMIFPFSVLLAVAFRSTMACVVGSVAFWFVCYAVNYSHAFTQCYQDLNPNGQPLPGFTVVLSELGYWFLPKPADFVIMLEQAMALDEMKITLGAQPPFETLLRKGNFDPMLSLLTSLLFCPLALWASASQLAKTDY